MSAFRRIPIDRQPGKTIIVEDGATKGARLGTNLYDTDGTLLSWQTIMARVAQTVTSPQLLWNLIVGIPANIKAIAGITTTGFYVRTGAGTAATRTLTVVAGELSGSNLDGVAANPQLGLADVALGAGGTLQAMARDGKGRITHLRNANQADIDAALGYAAVQSIVPGDTSITVDDTDPRNPIIYIDVAGADVTVDDSGWVWITGDDVQEAFDSVDDLFASVDTALAGKQPLHAILTGLAAMGTSTGLVEQTGASSFVKRAIGVGASTSIPTRADADARYDAIGAAAAAQAASQPVDALLTSLSLLAFAGNALKSIRVNAGATDWEFFTASGGTGDVVGPASAVDDRIATFDGITGKLLQDGGLTITQVLADAATYTDFIAASLQPLDPDLTDIANLAPSDDDIIQRKAGAWVKRTLAQLLSDLNLGALYQPLATILSNIAAIGAGTGLIEKTGAATVATRALGVGAGTSIPTRADADTRYDANGAAAAAQAASQPVNARLTAYAALATAANKGLYFTADATPVTFDLTAAARTLLGDATVPRLGTTNTWVLAQTFTVAPVFTDAAGTRVALQLVYTAADLTTAVTSYPVSATTAGEVTAGLFGNPSVHMTAYMSSNRAGQFLWVPRGGSSIPDVHVRSSHSTDGGGGWTATGKLWHSLNDGAGSGLDADTVDGLHVGTSGAAIPALNVGNTWSAAQVFGQITTTLVIDAASGLGSNQALRVTDLNQAHGLGPMLVSAASSASNIPFASRSYAGITVPLTSTGYMQFVSTIEDKTRPFIRTSTASTWGPWAELQRRGGLLSTAAAGAVTPNIDLDDLTIRTALTAGITIGAPVGTKVWGRRHTIVLADNGTIRSLTWNGEWVGSSTQALPTATVVGKKFVLDFVADSDSNLMRLIGYHRTI